jgi:hypothetical protein
LSKTGNYLAARSPLKTVYFKNHGKTGGAAAFKEVHLYYGSIGIAYNRNIRRLL